MSTKDAEFTREVFIRPSSVLLWITIFTGPAAFAISMQSRYALVYWACGNKRAWVLLLIAITAVVAGICSTVVAWSAYSRLDYPLQRARFMAMSGFILSGIFTLAMIANTIPQFFFHPCD